MQKKLLGTMNPYYITEINIRITNCALKGTAEIGVAHIGKSCCILHRELVFRMTDQPAEQHLHFGKTGGIKLGAFDPEKT